LIELYGGEDVLRARIDALKEANLPGTEEILEVSEKYASGWRPKDFGDD
jgi:hypothetical protein